MSKILTVYLLRHGQTYMNAEDNRYCGLTDAALTDVGREQARAAGGMLKSFIFDAIYASPLRRSKDTAEMLGLDCPVLADARLTELDFGSWEGKTREEFILENPKSWEKWNENPKVYPAGGDGETAQSAIDRLENFFDEKIIDHKGKNILIVGHNGLNRIFLSHKLGMPIKNYRSILQENSRITLFTLSEESEFQLQKLNC